MNAHSGDIELTTSTSEARGMVNDLDLRLVKRLRYDGRITNRSLAAELNVSEATVAARYRRLEAQGIVRVTAVTDINLFGHREFAFAMVNVSGRPVPAVAADLAKLPEALSVMTGTGRFDVIVPLLGRDRRHLFELLAHSLPAIEGVARVHASMVLDVVKYDSHWCLFGVDHGVTPVALPSESVDQLDLDIIRLLQDNARRSNRQMAATLRVSEGTVRGRIRRMLTANVFRIEAVLDVTAFGYAAQAILAIKASPGNVDRVANAVRHRDDITQITRVLDEFDLLVVLIAPNQETLLNTAFTELAGLQGVAWTEVFVTSKCVKHNYAWTWIV